MPWNAIKLSIKILPYRPIIIAHSVMNSYLRGMACNRHDCANYSLVICLDPSLYSLVPSPHSLLCRSGVPAITHSRNILDLFRSIPGNKHNHSMVRTYISLSKKNFRANFDPVQGFSWGGGGGRKGKINQTCSRLYKCMKPRACSSMLQDYCMWKLVNILHWHGCELLLCIYDIVYAAYKFWRGGGSHLPSPPPALWWL